MTDHPQNFWSSLPGVLTGIAAVITALTGLYIAMNGNNEPSASNTPGTEITAQLPDGKEEVTKQLPENKKIKTADPSPTQTIQSVLQEQKAATPEITKNLEPQTPEKESFPETGPLVDCSLFPTVNTVTSLMSWSNHYHQQIIAANGAKRRSTDPCNQTIDFRGMAHCKAPNDLEIRQALFETLTLCRAAGIEWQDIQHSSILGKE